MKKRVISWAVGLFMVCLFVWGSIAVMAEQGGSDDPIVTKSYIDSVLTPSVNEKIDEVVAQKMAESKSYVDTAISNHKAYIAQNGGGTGLSRADIDKIADEVIAEMQKEGISAGASWSVVTVDAGKTLKAKVGTEIVLRIGSATCYSPGSVGIVNLTSGSVLSPGSALSANNLYMVSIEDRGFKAGSNGATVLVSGSYTIS